MEEKKDSKEALYSTQNCTVRSSMFSFAHVHASYPSAELQSCGLGFRVGLVCILVLCLFLFAISNSVGIKTRFFSHEGLAQILEIKKKMHYYFKVSQMRNEIEP